MQPQQQDPVQQNNMARAVLQTSAVPVRKRIGVFTGFTLGQSAKIRLLNSGLTLAVRLKITATIDTTTAIFGLSGQHGLVQRVTLTDYNQIDRVDTDAYSLMIANSRRRDEILDAYVSRQVQGSAAATIPYPQIVTTANAQKLVLWLDVPFAVDPNRGDLRGISLSQTVVGEQFVTVRFADALVDADPTKAPFISGTAILTAGSDISVEVWQEFVQPQTPAAIPLIDASTVYEIKGLYRSTSDIATNGQKLINYPNVRTVLGSTHLCVLNNLEPTEAALSSIQMLANSSQILNDHSLASKLREQSNRFNALPSAAVLDYDHRAFPIMTALYGNIQLAFNFGVTPGGNSFIQSQFESLYASGSPLPGISTQ